MEAKAFEQFIKVPSTLICIILYSSLSCQSESKAFLKSTKQENTFFLVILNILKCAVKK